MDPRKFMIITKGKVSTKQIRSCTKNASTHKFDIVFENGKKFSYAQNNVIFMHSPIIIPAKDVVVETPDKKTISNIEEIYEFNDRGEKYWHLVLNGFALDYKRSQLKVCQNCLLDKKSSNTFEYLKAISRLNNLKNDDGERLLQKIYEKLSFVSDGTALSAYLNPQKRLERRAFADVIFPFGCNQSQYQAVKNALENQISIIQGPPGTGKTQTILNIIANLLINDKTVLVVSNNNSATQNVLEKLSKEQYGMGFLVASLGSADNKEAFIKAQTGEYPDLSKWSGDGNDYITLRQATMLTRKLQRVFQLQEEIALLREKRYAVEIEYKHFEEYTNETAADYKAIKVRGKRSSGKIMRLWQELQDKANQLQSLSFWFKCKSILVYGIANWSFYKQDLAKIISVLQGMYYQQSLREIDKQIASDEKELANNQEDYGKMLEEKSLIFLKAYLQKKYPWKNQRRVFTGNDFYLNPGAVLREYPVVLSTTFSARTSLNTERIEYDYVIMDEASQVDLATGALALSCAKNAVIVGDLKQLPNVVTNEDRQRAEATRTGYNISDAYDYAKKSFLSSMVEVRSDVPSTLLREHYRCHPRIIGFCNQKFYGGELVIMTEDDNKGEALKAIKTVEGNHARGHYNQRQIDVIKNEILPNLNVPKEEIGIIAPYNEQVNQIQSQIDGIDVATVHKFQGREKDVIILSTVDNEIQDFTDDPYLLNVAVSRAKKRLIVVVSGNKQEEKGNIVDLISYIQYNGMEVIDSKTYSVFDYLYAQYREQRWKYLKDKKRISQYDSENLTYHMLLDILKDHPEYGVQCFEPLSMVVRDLSPLSDEEVKYVLNPATHLDFMIFNKLSKQPIAAIETDGYVFHKEGTLQHERDIKKDHILELSGLKLIRLNTTGSGEKEKVLRALGLE